MSAYTNYLRRLGNPGGTDIPEEEISEEPSNPEQEIIRLKNELKRTEKIILDWRRIATENEQKAHQCDELNDVLNRLKEDYHKLSDVLHEKEAKLRAALSIVEGSKEAVAVAENDTAEVKRKEKIKNGAFRQLLGFFNWRLEPHIKKNPEYISQNEVKQIVAIINKGLNSTIF